MWVLSNNRKVQTQVFTTLYIYILSYICDILSYICMIYITSYSLIALKTLGSSEGRGQSMWEGFLKKVGPRFSGESSYRGHLEPQERNSKTS